MVIPHTRNRVYFSKSYCECPDNQHYRQSRGRDKKTLFGIVFYGAWGTPSARNRIIAIPTIAQGFSGRAK